MNLYELINKSVSPFHTVEVVKKMLLGAGFEELNMQDEWKLEKGKDYMVALYGTSIVAFSVGEEFEKEDGFRIAAAHGDFPGFSLKPNPQIEKRGYLMLNTEVYGGVNFNTWLDRPLSLAGRVVIKSEDVFHPRMELVDMEKPLLVIPSVAVHLNREVNKGTELKAQTHMIPLAGLTGGEKQDCVLRLLADHLNVLKEDILDYELQVYNCDSVDEVGFGEELISGPRLDNLCAVYALANGIIEAKRWNGINMMVSFDHEEVGSGTKQGAGSVLLAHLVEKIYCALGYTVSECRDAYGESMLLSVDASQGYHPSYGEKYDPTNQSVLGKGFSIKRACKQSYATDSEAIGIVKQICEQEGITYQNYVNHSDIPGGGTLGTIAVRNIPVKAVDVGVPMLAMHSSRELISKADQESLECLVQAYFRL